MLCRPYNLCSCCSLGGHTFAHPTRRFGVISVPAIETHEVRSYEHIFSRFLCLQQPLITASLPFVQGFRPCKDTAIIALHNAVGSFKGSKVCVCVCVRALACMCECVAGHSVSCKPSPSISIPLFTKHSTTSLLCPFSLSCPTSILFHDCADFCMTKPLSIPLHD